VHFTKLFVKNAEVETTQDPPQWVFKYVGQSSTIGDPPLTENQSASLFFTSEIDLLDNGWVFVGAYDDHPSQCFPPWRVITLEDLDTGWHDD